MMLFVESFNLFSAVLFTAASNFSDLTKQQQLWPCFPFWFLSFCDTYCCNAMIPYGLGGLRLPHRSSLIAFGVCCLLSIVVYSMVRVESERER